MNLILLATFIALSSAAQLPSRNYIPQNQGGGGYQGGQGGNYQGGSGGSYQGSGGFGGSGGGFGGSGGEGNTRAQQQQEKNAAVLKQDQAIDENSGNYHFGYETENGIRAEEQGNPTDAQGGFSYKGDDGIIYTVTYTAGESGFRPQGEHLPVAPPTPEAILEALQQNAKDEAAGIFDDGKYNPDVHGGPDAGGNKPGNGGFGGNGNRPNGNSGFGGTENGGFGGNGNSGFGGNGNHQNGFNNGYTY